MCSDHQGMLQALGRPPTALVGVGSVEQNKDHLGEKSQHSLLTAKEPATLTCVLAEAPGQAEEWKRFSEGNRGGCRCAAARGCWRGEGTGARSSTRGDC